jgi:hypothetical protein
MAEAEVAGRFLRHEHEGTLQGRSGHAEEIIAFNSMSPRFKLSWIGDFHMNCAIMFSEDEAADRGFVVTGTHDVGPDVPPYGQEAKAVETRYRRYRPTVGRQ